jgi:predicted transcriptional regulator YdeE
MEPVITQKPEILLMGMSFYGDPFSQRGGWEAENEIGCLWTRLMKYMSENGEKIQHLTQPGVAYEVHIYNEETITQGVFEVFAGVPVEKLEDVPVELLIRILPPSEYAIFTFKGEEITSDWHMQIDQWIAAAGYQRAHPFSFQYLDERFKGVDNLAESILDVYMPVKPLTPNP